MRTFDAFRLPGILRETVSPPATREDTMSRLRDRGANASRFRQESHALGASVASPGALFIAATIAVALYLIGCRLSD